MCVVVLNQRPAYELRISDWSSDVCSSDLISASIRGDAYNRGLSLAQGDHAATMGALSTAAGQYGDLTGQGISAMGIGNHMDMGDRKSVVSGTSVSVRVDLGGRRIIKKKTIF